MKRFACWTPVAGVALALTGCAPAPMTDTGAREAVRSFYHAIMRREWAEAYTRLHPDSQARWDKERFTRQATSYRRRLGFEPSEVRIRACEEQGSKAKAHVTLTGQANGRAARYKDALLLRQGPSGWGVVLPEKFGR